MKVLSLVEVGLLVVAPLVAVALGGCGADSSAPGTGGIDAGNESPTVRDWLRRRPLPRRDAGAVTVPDAGTATAPEVGPAVPIGSPPPPSTGGGSGAFDCKICSRANDCCGAVAGGPPCTFSAATCSALSPVSQASYVENCAALIRITRDAWTSSGQAPPAACTLD